MKRKVNWPRVNRDKEELAAAGYYIKEFSDVHWRIRDKSGAMLDIWPTSRKMMLVDSFNSQAYTDIVADARRTFLGVGKPVPLPRWWKKYQEAMQPIYEMRERLAQDIDERVKNSRLLK